jgi:two-component system OmpR family response regulator
MERILVVDDEPVVLDMVCAVLQEAGYEVIGTEHPVVAVDMIARVNPDVVLIDLMLPEIDGVELARRIREQHNGTAARLIAMSASTGMLRRAGASGFFQVVLSKPFDLDDLVGAVEPNGEDAFQARS